MGFSVLATSFVLEGITFWMAFQALRTGAQNTRMSFINYMRYAADPMQVAVFCEDGAAVLGIPHSVCFLFTSIRCQHGICVSGASTLDWQYHI